MRMLIFMLIFCMASVGIFAQSITPTVVSSSGDFKMNADGTSLVWTVGESSIDLLSAPNNMISQGFQQPAFSNCSVKPAKPASITQTLVDNSCNARVYRYTASIVSAANYMWTIPSSLGGITGVLIDSGDLNNSRVIKLKFLSNAAAFSTDSIKVRTFNSCGYSANTSDKLTAVELKVPVAPASITITPIQTNVCGVKIYRYAAPVTVPAASSTLAAVTGWYWKITGILAMTASLDSGTWTSKVIRVKYSSNDSAVVGDSVKLAYNSDCGYSNFKASKLTNTLLTTAVPASITITLIQTNVCGAKIYRYAAPVTVPAASSTVAAVTGWYWNITGTLAMTASLDSGTWTSKVIRVKYSSNNAAVAGDSVKLAYNSDCGYGNFKASKLTNTLLTTAVPASITVTALQTNVCRERIYRYRAPALAAATATNAAATGYLWTMPFGPVGATGVLDSGLLTGSVIRILYTSNSLAGAGDSIKLAYTSPCGTGPSKVLKLTNTATIAPLAPASITTQLVSDVCGGRVYRYIAPNLPAATATAVAPIGWEWTWVGLLASTAVIDSGTIFSQKIKLRFASNNASAVGDSMKLRYTTSCTAPTLWKAQKFSNVAKLGCKGFISKINVYPNPATESFQLEVKTKSTKPMSIEVTDVQGRVVWKYQGLYQNKIQMGASWIPGMYQIQIIQNGEKQIRKIIKISASNK